MSCAKFHVVPRNIAELHPNTTLNLKEIPVQERKWWHGHLCGHTHGHMRGHGQGYCMDIRGGRFFRAFALASAKRKKERESAKKKEREKKRKRRARKKKARIRAFSSTLSGNPVSEPKAARQGEKQRS